MLALRGFSYTKSRDTMQVGPLKATIQQRERVPIPPLLSAVVIIAGVGLVVFASRRRS